MNRKAIYLLIIIYLAFISLGLPDPMLGSAWPTMYPEMRVPVSYAGILSMIISVGTVVSSLLSHRLTKKLGTGKVTAISVLMTAVALYGFSVSNNFLLLIIWAIPYGLGAGGVDAALNNYVATHYASRHMSWLHCMWGVGTIIGPYVMGYVLALGKTWNDGYKVVAITQFGLAFLLVATLFLWKENQGQKSVEKTAPISLKHILKLPGVKEVMATFFCYCALEQTAMLWASSYMVLHKGVVAEVAARYAGMFFIGITAGRAVSGFMTLKLKDTEMIRLGQCVILSGIVVMLLPFGRTITLIGLIMVGLGCAPIYPSIIHSTPFRFGAEQSQAIIGVQMASAYVGTSLMPPLFGMLAERLGVVWLPIYLLVILVMMALMHERLLIKTRR